MTPEFWRSEIWHPLTVHFPIAFLLAATIVKACTVVLNKFRQPYALIYHFLLIAGWAGAWLAVYTGDLADGVVARKICDPTVLKSHELAAVNSVYLFSGAIALEVFLRYTTTFRKVLSLASLLLMISGSSYLIYAGHQGAELVYQQGAGVHKPGDDCN